jgi:hypothetical protein
MLKRDAVSYVARIPDAHHEAAKEQVSAARDQIDQRPEGRGTEREQQAHRQSDEQYRERQIDR